LNGSFGGDILKSYAGNDFISGNGGDDTLDGGDGTDTSQIAAASTAATITINADGTISVTDRNGVEGTDTLVSIENIAFTDRTLDMNAFSSLTQLSNDQFTELAEMYVAYFNRAPDAEGLFYWADKLAEGRTMDQIAERFFDQDETRALYTDPSNTDAFVTAVYANVLGRTPDADGFAFWTGKLAAGEVTQGAFVLKIILGAKNGGGANDVAYLSDKADVGLYFSAIKGMSDSTDGRQVMATFGDQSTSNKSGAKTAVDGHYADATVSGGGEFIFDVVGVVNDPFAGII
jgi:Ca2+-binding RTX toxin-like protein